MENRNIINSANKGFFWLSLLLDKFLNIFGNFHFFSGNSQGDSQETELKDVWHYSVGNPLIIPLQLKYTTTDVTTV